MTTKIKATEDFTGHEFVITREFDAPRELVFKAWTDPKHLAQWWGPKDSLIRFANGTSGRRKNL